MLDGVLDQRLQDEIGYLRLHECVGDIDLVA